MGASWPPRVQFLIDSHPFHVLCYSMRWTLSQEDGARVSPLLIRSLFSQSFFLFGKRLTFRPDLPIVVMDKGHWTLKSATAGMKISLLSIFPVFSFFSLSLTKYALCSSPHCPFKKKADDD